MLSSSLAMEAACLVRGTGRNTGVDILQEAKIQNGSSLTSLVTANKRDAAAFGAFFFLAVHTTPHRYKLSRTSLISKQVNTAQLVEHQTVMERVMGSNLCMVIDFYFFLHLFSTS